MKIKRFHLPLKHRINAPSDFILYALYACRKKQFKASGKKPLALSAKLFTKTELMNDCTVSFDIDFLKVCEEVTSVTYHFKKASS